MKAPKTEDQKRVLVLALMDRLRVSSPAGDEASYYVEQTSRTQPRVWGSRGSVVRPLISEGWIEERRGAVRITDKGERALAALERWVACGRYDSDSSTVGHRHIVRKWGDTTACGATASTPDVWRPDVKKPKCAACLQAAGRTS